MSTDGKIWLLRVGITLLIIADISVFFNLGTDIMAEQSTFKNGTILALLAVATIVVASIYTKVSARR